MRDLVLLVADKDAQFALKGGLVRHHSLGIRPIDFAFIVHPRKDGGVRTEGHSLLALEHTRFKHALLLLDHEGSGTDKSPEELEADLDEKLRQTWGVNGKAIVLYPEVDIWMWGSDNALEELFRWERNESIRAWLRKRGFEFDASGKPQRPKEAFGRMLREIRTPRSSALYEKVARKLSLQNCTDAAFQRLANQLRTWFPPAQ